MSTRFIITPAALLLTALFACGANEGDDQTTAGTCDPNVQGDTNCGANFQNICKAGQYCSDETFSECSNGCLSDNNCACNQVCVIPSNDSVGTCRNQAQAVCGNMTCEAGETAATCAADCGTTGPVCGNGACEAGETTATCAADCGGQGPVCGNSICEMNEVSSCVDDCRNELITEAKGICNSYDFFMCFGPGELQGCLNAVDGGTAVQLVQYINCAGIGAPSCDACLQFLQ